MQDHEIFLNLKLDAHFNDSRGALCYTKEKENPERKKGIE